MEMKDTIKLSLLGSGVARIPMIYVGPWVLQRIPIDLGYDLIFSHFSKGWIPKHPKLVSVDFTLK